MAVAGTTHTYSGNQIFITTDGNPASYDTTTLNNFGFVHSSTSTRTCSFCQLIFYTLDTVLSYTVFISPLLTSPDTARYHFTDGDLTSYFSGGTTFTYTYYHDKSGQAADLSNYDQMVPQGALAYRNKHLTKSFSSNSFSQEYSYTFDTSGKILSITNHYMNSQSSGTITYYYYAVICNVECQNLHFVSMASMFFVISFSPMALHFCSNANLSYDSKTTNFDLSSKVSSVKDNEGLNWKKQAFKTKDK